MEQLQEIIQTECLNNENVYYSFIGLWDEFKAQIESHGVKAIVLDEGYGHTDFVMINPETERVVKFQ